LIGHGCDPVKILSIEKSVRVTNILAKVWNKNAWNKSTALLLNQSVQMRIVDEQLQEARTFNALSHHILKNKAL
jgi:hypothetical protein